MNVFVKCEKIKNYVRGHTIVFKSDVMKYKSTSEGRECREGIYTMWMFDFKNKNDFGTVA